MQRRTRSFVRSASITLSIGAVLLFSIVGSMVYLVYKTQEYVDDVAQARRIRSAAADLLLAVQDAETGQRGYILTREEAFLKPYQAAIGKLGEREAHLEALLLHQDIVDIDPIAIRTSIESKSRELRQTLTLAQAGRQSEAMQIIREETGLRQMNTIRSTLTTIIGAADTRIEERFASNLQLATLLRLTTVFAGLAIVLVMVGFLLVIRRFIREIVAARGELENLNASLEDRVRERTEDLIQANQEIQRYAYIVTHDLRAPLVNIMGFTAELDSALNTIRGYFADGEEAGRDDARENARLAVSEDLPEAISFIRSSTRKMDKLINAILKISRDGRRPLNPEALDLEDLIKASTDAVRHQVVDADGEIDVKVTVRHFVSDRFSIEQILGNLFDNAVKYRDTSRPLKLTVRAFQVNRYTVGIDVADNGRGIAAEDHERIFELFRRSGVQDREGEGIGLAHVRSLIRNMGGDINVKSQTGAGTTFMIRLPQDLSQFVRSMDQ
jgi:signal transduction histidine kinase